MKNAKYILLSLLFSVTSAHAEWTGDKEEGMISNTIITDFHTGQISGHPYFCVNTQKEHPTVDEAAFSLRACAVKDVSVWGPSYATFYDMALYFHSTGQPIRLYYKPGVWTDKDFKNFTSNALVGLSSCGTNQKCFGPERRKPN